ncbi:hypothetical protein MED222_05145 [Vibrio sp. MED222]|nr:hypothetical protein MED222_05145 [Vibrio sp. MED222]
MVTMYTVFLLSQPIRLVCCSVFIPVCMMRLRCKIWVSITSPPQTVWRWVGLQVSWVARWSACLMVITH